jgi:hypothetical protein
VRGRGWTLRCVGCVDSRSRMHGWLEVGSRRA